MLEGARQLAESKGFSLTTRQHPAEELPYADATFSLVACRVAPHHFSSPGKFVKEVARVLKSDGQFLLIDGSVPDDEPELEEWLHEVEKLRDPSHARFLSPRAWEAIAVMANLRVEYLQTSVRLQPNSDWYFEVASTSESNRLLVRDLVASASPRIRNVMGIQNEGGGVQWNWTMVTMICSKRVHKD